MLKGSIPVRRSVLIVSVALGGALLTGMIATVDGEIISPSIGNITEELTEYQTPTVQIGDDGVTQDDARREFKGLVTYNMLTAANCNLVPLTTNGLNGGDTDIIYFEGFDTAVNGLNYEFTNDCVQEVVPDGALDLIDFNDVEESGDLEGRQGKMNFNVSQSFTISQEELIKAEYDSDFGDGFLVFNGAPHFWDGERVAGFVPDGIRDADNWDRAQSIFDDETTQGPDIEWIDGSDTPIYSKLYSYRVRMTGVPTIIDSDSFIDDDGRKNFDEFVATARYQLCEGASGTIQSNAKYLNFGGEAQGDDSAVENAVYPEVQITQGSLSCLQNFLHESDYNGRDFVDYSITGERCTYQDLNNEIRVEDTGVNYTCMLMEDSTEFSDYDGQVNFLKTGWKADQDTCSSTEYDLTDEQPTNIETSEGERSEEIVQSFEEYESPDSFTTEVTLSYPEGNTRPGNIFFNMPRPFPDGDELADINIYNPVNPLSDQRTVLQILNSNRNPIDLYDKERIFTDDETQSFRFRYDSGSQDGNYGAELTVTHLDSGESISVNIRDESRRLLIEEKPQQFSMWINDQASPPGSENNQQMSLEVEETVLESYPLGCVPEAMNE